MNDIVEFENRGQDGLTDVVASKRDVISARALSCTVAPNEMKDGPNYGV